MKKSVQVFFGLLVLSAAAPAYAQCMADVRKTGLRVVTSPDYPPFQSLDAKNNIVGFDIDLLNAIGKQLGLKVTIVGQSFDGLIPSLLSKKADIVAAGMTITEERKKSVAFSMPYLSGPNAIVVRKENTDIRKLADLKGKTIAVQLGSAQEKIAQDVEGGKPKSYNLYTDAALAVQTRQAESMILHSVVAKQFVKTYPDLKIAATIGSIRTGLAMRKDCPDLTNRINTAIIQLRRSGELDKLVAKWFK